MYKGCMDSGHPRGVIEGCMPAGAGQPRGVIRVILIQWSYGVILVMLWGALGIYTRGKEWAAMGLKGMYG